MSRNAWHGLPPSKDTDPSFTPQHITKQEFGRRLYERMIRKGWNQSELARRAGIGRDSISTYVRGVSLPDPLYLQKLADALDCKPEDLLPNAVESAMDREHPAMEIRQAQGDTTKVWLRVNRIVPPEVASEIFAIINKADRADRGGSK